MAVDTSTTGHTDAWWQLLGLRPADAHAAAVRGAFRRLAALVHPDKCSLPRSAEAFARLQAGVEGLLRELEVEGERLAKRQRAESESAGLDSLDDLDDGWATAASEEEAAEFPWWGKWDEPRWAPAPPPEGDLQHAQADARRLAAMDVEQLRVEVRARQAALLAPGGSAPLECLNEELRRARALLSRRLEEAAARAAAQADGGFLRS